MFERLQNLFLLRAIKADNQLNIGRKFDTGVSHRDAFQYAGNL